MQFYITTLRLNKMLIILHWSILSYFFIVTLYQNCLLLTVIHSCDDYKYKKTLESLGKNRELWRFDIKIKIIRKEFRIRTHTKMKLSKHFIWKVFYKKLVHFLKFTHAGYVYYNMQSETFWFLQISIKILELN